MNEGTDRTITVEGVQITLRRCAWDKCGKEFPLTSERRHHCGLACRVGASRARSREENHDG